MHNVGSTQLRSTSFYNAFFRAYQSGRDTFKYNGQTYKIYGHLIDQVKHDLHHDFMNGFIKIKVV